jgi:hypothetical protein
VIVGGVAATLLDTVNDVANAASATTFILGNVSGAPTSVVANFSPNQAFITLIAVEESGCLAASNPTDVHVGHLQTSPGTGANIINSGNVTTTVASDIIVGAYCDSVGTSVGTAGTSPLAFTLRTTDTAAGEPVATEDGVVLVTPGTAASTFGQTVNDTALSFVIAIKPTAAAGIIDTPAAFGSTRFPSQWNRNLSLLRGRAVDESSSAVETNTYFRPRTYLPQWQPTRALRQNAATDAPAVSPDAPTYFVPRTWPQQWALNRFLGRNTAQDTSSSAVETNTNFKPSTWPFQWNLIRFQNPAVDVLAAVADDPPAFIPRFFPRQWNLSFLRGTSQDFTSPAVETNPHWTGKPWVVSWKVNPLLGRSPSMDVPPPVIPDAPPGLVPHTWRVQWVVNLSLLRGTAQDFSSIPPPIITFPATYYILEDQWVDNRFYLPAGTIQSTQDLGGVLPLNWVPNPNVDPVDVGAVVAYTAVGYQPRGLFRQQYAGIPVTPANYVWQFINGAYVLVKVASFPRVPIDDPQG